MKQQMELAFLNHTLQIRNLADVCSGDLPSVLQDQRNVLPQAVQHSREPDEKKA